MRAREALWTRGAWRAWVGKWPNWRRRRGCTDELAEAHERVSEARELLGSSDSELAELARDELDEAQAEIAEIRTRAVDVLVSDNPDDARNAIVEVRAGTGGDEAALFAGDLLRMYSR